MKSIYSSLSFFLACFCGIVCAQDYNDIDAVTGASLEIIGGRAYETSAKLNFTYNEDIHGDNSGKYGPCKLRWGANTNYSDGEISMDGYDKGSTGTKTLNGLSGNTRYYYEIDLKHEEGSSYVKGEFTTWAASSTLTAIEVTPASVTKDIDQTQQFTATGTYSDNSQKNITDQVTWKSSSNGIATVNSSGLGTAKGEGTATITASLDGVDGTSECKVNAPPVVVTLSSITVTPATASIGEGDTRQFIATGNYSDGSDTVITDRVTWDTDDDLIATISTSGLATGVAEGTVTVTASLNTVDGTASLTINAVVATLTAITISPASADKKIGENQKYTANGKYSDGSSQDISTAVSWSSSNGLIATISNAGLAAAKGEGTATLTAKLDGDSATAELVVSAVPVTLTSLAISPTSVTKMAGETQQLTVTGNYSDGSSSNVSSSASWSSSNDLVAAVNNTGLVTAVGEGNATITASLDGKDITVAIVVEVPEAVLTSISITPAFATIDVGNTEKFTATGTYSNGTTQDISGEVLWQVLDPAIASVKAGTVTPLTAGQTQILVSQGTVFQSAVLTVNGVGVSRQFSANGIHISANPFRGTVHLTLDEAAGEHQLLVVSPQGETLHQASVTAPYYTWNNQGKAGVYYLIIKNSRTGSVVNRIRAVLF